MNTILLIVGLPGSGKTYLAQELAQESIHSQVSVVDDITDLSELPDAGDFIITDVNFCDKNILDKAWDILREKYPDHHIRTIFFENDPIQCRANVERRADGRNVEGTLRRFVPIYNPPDHAKPVWRPLNS